MTALLLPWLVIAFSAAAAFGQVQPGTSSAQPASTPTVVAKVGGEVITLNQVDDYIGREVYGLALKLYTLRRQALASMIDASLVRQQAHKEGVTELEMLSRLANPLPAPSAAEIQYGFASHYDSLWPMGEVAARFRIALDLQDHVRSEAVRTYLDNLKRDANVEVFLAKPEFRLRARPTACRLSRPEAGAQLVVFLDYECPFCRKIEPVLEKLIAEEPTRSSLGVSIKQMPLSIHTNAYKAAVAATCASRQNRFPAFHAALFAAEDRSQSGLDAVAEKTGLDLPAFRACLAGEDAQIDVLLDMEEARRAGVQGTPSLFLNGELIEGREDGDKLREYIVSAIRQGRPEGASGLSR
jgi:predicted DsbA family dithiol-disulfide isomerase